MSWKIAYYHSVKVHSEMVEVEERQTKGGRRAVGRSAEMEVAGEQEQEQHGGLEQKHWGGGCWILWDKTKGVWREQKVPNCVPETGGAPHRRQSRAQG